MINSETLNSNMIREEIIICDWDGVIQQPDVLWIKKVIENIDTFKPYYDFTKITDSKGQLDPTMILQRDTYYLDEWMKKSDTELSDEIKKAFIDLYMNDKVYYEKCPFLIMASGLRNILTQKFVKQIVFLSSAPKGFNSDIRKEIQLQKFFGTKNDKVKIDVIEGNIKKCDYINENYPNYTSFIDDRSDIVRDVINNTDSKNKTFLLPIYNYNKEIFADDEFKNKCANSGIVLNGYMNNFAKKGF